MGYLGTKPANQVIDSALIADGTITTSDLANGAVTPAKLSTGAPTWDTSGNVGIGTSSPVSLGAGYGTVDVRGSSGGGFRWGSATNSSYTYSDSAGLVISTANALPLSLSTNNTERMRIDSSGNVYVGSDTTCNLTDFRSKSLSSSGYQKIAGGLILQWVQVTTTTATSGTASFSWPIAFPSSCFMAAPACNVNDSGELGSSISTSGGTLNFAAYSSASKTFTIFGVGV